jgi:hypothetical protein
MGRYIKAKATGGGSTGFTDEFSVAIKAEDTNALQTDDPNYAITLAQEDTNAVQTEAVKLGFPAGVFGDGNTQPTDSNNFDLKVWLSGSAGAGSTNPANADGENDGILATLETVALGDNPIILVSALGANVPSVTLSSLLYRGWFKAINAVVTSNGSVTVKSTGALFADIVMYTNSIGGQTDDYLDGSFTYDLFSAGVNTLAKAQSITIEHSVSDLAAGVTPHVMTIDAGSVEISGAFI